MSYATAAGEIRGALFDVLATTGISVVAYPGDTQSLPAPCWCIGIPNHEPDPSRVRDSYCAEGWSMVWPIVLYVIQSPDRTSTDVIDEQVGRFIEAIRSDPTLGGLLTVDAEIPSVSARLGPERDVRLHEVTATVLTTSNLARP